MLRCICVYGQAYSTSDPTGLVWSTPKSIQTQSLYVANKSTVAIFLFRCKLHAFRLHFAAALLARTKQITTLRHTRTEPLRLTASHKTHKSTRVKGQRNHFAAITRRPLPHVRSPATRRRRPTQHRRRRQHLSLWSSNFREICRQLFEHNTRLGRLLTEAPGSYQTVLVVVYLLTYYNR